MADFVVIGNPESRRVALFQAALDGLGLPPARCISYLDILDNRADWKVSSDSVVRIESPDRNFEVECGILRLGADVDDPDDPSNHYHRLTTKQIDDLVFDKGRILPSRQWYLGYCEILHRIEDRIGQAQVMNHPSNIRIMFDKPRCQECLKEHHIAVPLSLDSELGLIHSYPDLLQRMQLYNLSSVFIKLAHGSSGSGVVAYRFNGNHHQAITTVDMVSVGGEIHLYNSRKMRVYHDLETVSTLVDALCKHRVHVAAWMPKAGIANKTFDLRIVIIAGQVRHVVPRLSASPITNLHLLNERGNLEDVLAAIGTKHWPAACQTCTQAAQIFSNLYIGIDLLFTPNYKQHAIVEMNAFGDLLPGILHNGEDTYTAEIKAVMEGEYL